MAKKSVPSRKSRLAIKRRPSHERVEQTRAIDELSGQPTLERRPIAWEAPQFQEYQRGWLWLLGLVIITLSLAAIFFTINDYSAMVVVLLAAVVIYQQANAKPKQIVYRIDEDGIHIGSESLDWTQLKAFWLSAPSGAKPHLYLETTNRWHPVRTIHLVNVDPADLQARLEQFLPEHLTRGEATADLLVRWLKL
ncbi:hypothetical protein HY524_01535 [Candidatus Berkelbacteria bacterium]|nr:hypothetical protein [Candidatus Berkelbacteria bacterium]